jgi:RNA polymerase primary sigma factor
VDSPEYFTGLSNHARTIRLPLNKVVLNSRIHRSQAILEQELGRMPSAEELSELMNIDLEEITSSFAINNRPVSLDNPISEDEDGTLMDTLINPNAESSDGALQYTESLKKEITRSLNILTDRQKETLCYFYGIGIDRAMSLEDIGNRFQLTPERVRQIKDKALTKLRTQKTFHLLRGYLGS